MNVLNDGAGGRTAGGDHAVDRIRDGIARGVQFLDGVAQADGEIFDVDGLAVLQREFAALMEDQIVGGAAAAVGLGVGVVVEDLLSVFVGEVDLKAELLRRVRFADDRLCYLQVGGFLLDVDAGDGRKREAHVAGGAGSAALGVEEGERVLAGIPLLQIVPQINVLADGGVNAADVADELVVQEHPHVVVTEEVILQRADIILRQLELHSVLHTEEGVVRNAVIAVGKSSAFGGCGSICCDAVCTLYAGIVFLIICTIRAKVRVTPVCGRIERPEVICKNAGVGRGIGRRRVEEIFQLADGTKAVCLCGGKCVGIAHL